MFFIFEMANNHQGSIHHAKAIIDDFSEIKDQYNLNAGIKIQLRNLDTFIHPKFIKSDLKYVKRFNETRLNSHEFKEILGYARSKGMKTVATPFDNESLRLLDKLDIDIVKVASCSCDDWPLLREIAKQQRKIIISTAGATMETLHKVYDLFKSNQRDFAFMHCVGDYPTKRSRANLHRIVSLKEEFPDIEVGFSTHESPDEKSLVPFAYALGCTIFEKHVGKVTETIKLNAYSCTKEQYKVMVKDLKDFSLAYTGVSDTQNDSLKKLKRGVYVNKGIPTGHIISQDDIFFAMPCQGGQLDASMIDKIIGSRCLRPIGKDEPIKHISINQIGLNETEVILRKVKNLLLKAKIPFSPKDKCEISCHYGIDNFNKYGAFIIDKVNREYCKKLIIMFPGQKHPEHYHLRKEETFELIGGDCKLFIKGNEFNLELGVPFLIPRGVHHSFQSKNGCVVEEISTTHHIGDSVYSDPVILRKSLENRKIKCSLYE